MKKNALMSRTIPGCALVQKTIQLMEMINNTQKEAEEKMSGKVKRTDNIYVVAQQFYGSRIETELRQKMRIAFPVALTKIVYFCV